MIESWGALKSRVGQSIFPMLTIFSTDWILLGMLLQALSLLNPPDIFWTGGCRTVQSLDIDWFFTERIGRETAGIIVPWNASSAVWKQNGYRGMDTQARTRPDSKLMVIYWTSTTASDLTIIMVGWRRKGLRTGTIFTVKPWPILLDHYISKPWLSA